jgi:hypothetical protein
VIIASFGWNTLFVVLACAYLVAASMWAFVDPRRPFYEPAADPAQSADLATAPSPEPV